MYKEDGKDKICDYFTLVFNQNTAITAGNAIYGERMYACSFLNIVVQINDSCTTCPPPDLSKIMKYVGKNNVNNLSNFTTDPTRVCFCEGGIPQENCLPCLWLHLVMILGQCLELS